MTSYRMMTWTSRADVDRGWLARARQEDVDGLIDRLRRPMQATGNEASAVYELKVDEWPEPSMRVTVELLRHTIEPVAHDSADAPWQQQFASARDRLKSLVV